MPDPKSTETAVDHDTIAASANVLEPQPRAIYCHADGTLTIEGANGTARDYTMTAGDVLSFRPTKVTNIASGTFYAWF